uniref:Peptidase S1 domain-containing protein n=1 Tax=Anopheles atroparvus TaxID=41427 RepID=A0A182JAG3_ANOAO
MGKWHIALRFNEESSETSDVTCGKTNENGLFYELHSNETLAQYGEFPWVVYIFTTNETTSSGTFVCGGTLIHPLLVLTTAHNVHRKINLIARFGEWDIGTDKEPFPHQDVNVADVFIHPAFTLSPIQNDIAILFLKESIQYQPHIQPICLPQPDAVFDEQRCISNGWGTVEGTYAKIMKKLTLPVIPRAKCQRMLRFAGLGPFYKLREGFMCAGGEGIVDTCKGDGGSPLACQQQDGSFVLAGIVSWGIGCGGDNIPGVYVAINNYLREGFMCAGGEGIVDTCKGDGGSPLACQQQDGSFVLAGIVSWGIGCGGDNIPGVYVAINNYECAGGYCVQKELCPDGSYDETTLQDAGAISLKVGDGCQNDSQICCSAAGRFAVPEEVSDLSECGVSNTDGYRYESKGNHTHAQYAEFPWTVVIFESSRNSNVKGVAGAGSLLHPRFVLSAAHIFKQNVEWIARFGEWDLISEKHEVYPTQDINILPNIFIHPEYDKETLGNDIALAKLEREVVYKYHIRPICLPGPNDVFNGQRCISNGWGLDAKTNQYVNIMKRIELPVIPRKTCKQWFRATRLSPFFKLHKSVLCAGGETDADMCDGDGGGPLACRMEDGGYMLAGIVSWGLECNQQNVPGAYVDVAMFSEWIMSILNAA